MNNQPAQSEQPPVDEKAAGNAYTATSGSKLLRAWDDSEIKWSTYGNWVEKWEDRNFMRATFNNIQIGQYARGESDKNFRVYFGNTVFVDNAETADEAEAMIKQKFLDWIETLSIFPSNK